MLRRLAPALIVLALFGSVPALASAASGGFAAEYYPAYVEGAVGGSGTLQFNFNNGGALASCQSPPFTGILEGPSRSVAATGKNSTCTGGQTLEMHGCKFEMHPGTSTMDIGPAGCGPVTVPTNGVCGLIKVYPKTGLSAEYISEGTGGTRTVSISMSGSGLSYTVPGAPCKPGTFEDGEISGHWTVRAFEDLGGSLGPQIGLVSGKSAIPVGLSTSGSNVAAEAYPAEVTAKVLTGKEITLLKTEKWSVSCSQASVGALRSSKGLTEPSREFTWLGMGRTFENCEMAPFSLATVQMLNCGFTFSTSTAISCLGTEPSQHIVITPKLGGSSCHIYVPFQVIDAEGPQFSNLGLRNGMEAMVEAHAVGSGIHYTTEGKSCPLLGLPAEGEGATADLPFALSGTF